MSTFAHCKPRTHCPRSTQCSWNTMLHATKPYNSTNSHVLLLHLQQMNNPSVECLQRTWISICKSWKKEWGSGATSSDYILFLHKQPLNSATVVLTSQIRYPTSSRMHYRCTVPPSEIENKIRTMNSLRIRIEQPLLRLLHTIIYMNVTNCTSSCTYWAHNPNRRTELEQKFLYNDKFLTTDRGL